MSLCVYVIKFNAAIYMTDWLQMSLTQAWPAVVHFIENSYTILLYS